MSTLHMLPSAPTSQLPTAACRTCGSAQQFLLALVLSVLAMATAEHPQHEGRSSSSSTKFWDQWDLDLDIPDLLLPEHRRRSMLQSSIPSDMMSPTNFVPQLAAMFESPALPSCTLWSCKDRGHLEFSEVSLKRKQLQQSWPITPDTLRKVKPDFKHFARFRDAYTAQLLTRDNRTGLPLRSQIDFSSLNVSPTSQSLLRGPSDVGASPEVSRTSVGSSSNSTAGNNGTSNFNTLPIKWGGGKMLEAAYIHLIFVGDSWDVNTVREYSSVLNASIHFVSYLDTSDWWNISRLYRPAPTPQYNPTPGQIQLKQAKILPIAENKLTSELDLIEYLEYYLRTGKLQYYPNVSTYFFMLPNTNGRQILSPGNNDSCTNWCGLHSYVPAQFTDLDGKTLRYNITYGVVAHPKSCGPEALSRCAINGLWLNDNSTGKPVAPNGFVADAMISVMAHEMAEIFTDPFQDAWMDDEKNEVSDKCNFDFGTVVSDPTWWTNVIGGRKFLIQRIWDPVLQQCANRAT